MLKKISIKVLKILRSKKIITRFGTSIYELIVLGKKPLIYLHKESFERKKDIHNLVELNLANYFDDLKLNHDRKKNSNQKSKLIFGAINIIEKVKKIYNF